MLLLQKVFWPRMAEPGDEIFLRSKKRLSAIADRVKMMFSVLSVSDRLHARICMTIIKSNVLCMKHGDLKNEETVARGIRLIQARNVQSRKEKNKIDRLSCVVSFVHVDQESRQNTPVSGTRRDFWP